MYTIDLPGIHKIKSGKVREVFEVEGTILLVASDRISAFDYVFHQTIPDKGKVLNSISSFWFDHLGHVVSNHRITDNVDEYPAQLHPFRDILNQRS
ncbi:MAG: phosphoribosylaminoimidazolesuccinocarboxamide synthase, partial [Candidatus Margulisiibacteriota bacterium]